MGGEHAAEASMPLLMYGTAWKKGRTEKLTYAALQAGFTGVDTAAQPRHYDEALAGAAIKRALDEGVIARKDIFIQTKFTPPEWQDDDTIPYDPELPLEEQIHASIETSLAHLTTPEHPYIDCFVLHDPLDTIEDGIRFFEVLAGYVPHSIRSLGVSNFSLDFLQPIMDAPSCRVKPVVVQNRFSQEDDYNVPLRRYLHEKGIRYQSFLTLTGKPRLMDSAPARRLAHELDTQGVHEECAIAVAVYALVLALSDEGLITIMDGSSNAVHMRGDLQGLEIWRRWKEGSGKELFGEILAEFKEMIGENA